MPINELFSKRKTKSFKPNQKTYIYDTAPIEFRRQVVLILKDVVGNGYLQHRYNSINLYEFIVDRLCREYGVFVLPPCSEEDTEDKVKQLVEFMLEEENVDRLLDAIELSFSVMEAQQGFLTRGRNADTVEEAIDELNHRFQENQLGFRYDSGKVLRIDSQLIHEEVEKPALRLLSEPGYEGAQDEFLSAHAHYRLGNNKEALNECLKSFESTMKVICKKRNWKHEKEATAKPLISICFKNDLIPLFWQDHYSSLEKLLTNGVPTARNKRAGHGQGGDIVTVPNHIAAYVLHMTASAIVFLVESEKNLP